MRHRVLLGEMEIEREQTTSPRRYVYMLFFFSNRLGCLGSILISLMLTVILIGIFRGF